MSACSSTAKVTFLSLLTDAAVRILCCVVGGGGGGGGGVALSCAPLENTVRTNFEQKKVEIDWNNYVTRLLFWATRGQIFTRRNKTRRKAIRADHKYSEEINSIYFLSLHALKFLVSFAFVSLPSKRVSISRQIISSSVDLISNACFRNAFLGFHI